MLPTTLEGVPLDPDSCRVAERGLLDPWGTPRGPKVQPWIGAAPEFARLWLTDGIAHDSRLGLLTPE